MTKFCRSLPGIDATSVKLLAQYYVSSNVLVILKSVILLPKYVYNFTLDIVEHLPQGYTYSYNIFSIIITGRWKVSVLLKNFITVVRMNSFVIQACSILWLCYVTLSN
jgi:hypothetical protein